MKKKIIISLSLILLVVAIILSAIFIFNLNNKENMFVDISEYLDKKPGIYIINDKEKTYALVVYKSEYDATVKNLNIRVSDKEDKIMEEVTTNSNTRTLKKDEVGYFIGELQTIFDKENKYDFYVEFTDETIGKYIVNGINIEDYIGKPSKLTVSSSGLTICMYKNTTKSNVNVKNCEVVFRNSNDEEIETVIALPEKTTVKPNETIYFANYAKQYSDAVDFKFTTATFNFE